MNAQIERRIRAVERAVAALAPPAGPVKMMFYPDGGADDVARHEAEVDQAVRDGFFVIRLVPLKPKSEGDKA